MASCDINQLQLIIIIVAAFIFALPIADFKKNISPLIKKSNTTLCYTSFWGVLFYALANLTSKFFSRSTVSVSPIPD
jgi:hypothetical protein